MLFLIAHYLLNQLLQVTVPMAQSLLQFPQGEFLEGGCFGGCCGLGGTGLPAFVENSAGGLVLDTLLPVVVGQEWLGVFGLRLLEITAGGEARSQQRALPEELALHRLFQTGLLY
jgi:hypothetical protein